jgi:hypothetical protein
MRVDGVLWYREGMKWCERKKLKYKQQGVRRFVGLEEVEQDAAERGTKLSVFILLTESSGCLLVTPRERSLTLAHPCPVSRWLGNGVVRHATARGGRSPHARSLARQFLAWTTG